MKKLLGISLVAMMAVTTANAEIASKAYVDSEIGTIPNVPGTENRYADVITYVDAKAQAAVEGDVGDIDELSNSFDDNTDTVVDALNELMAEKADAVEAGGIAANESSATHTKITYNTQGIVTTGADLAIADLPESIVVNGTKTTVTHSAGGDYAVNVTVDGSVASANTGLVTGGDVYTAVQGAITTAEGYTDDKIGTLGNNASSQPYTNIKDYVDDKVAAASSGAADVIGGDLATDLTGFENGTDTVVEALNELQSEKLDKNADITASGANYKIVQYDTKGLVVAGKDLEATDIPTLTLSKISDAGTAAAAETSDFMPAVSSSTTGTDGTYVLTMKIVDNTPTYKWETIQR